MKTKKVMGLAIAGAMLTVNSFAQFTVTGQYMSRGEYRHGYGSLADTGQKASMFVSQRMRINGEYKTEKYRIYASMQDVRTWGNVGNSAIDNLGYLSLFEGYGELYFNKKITAKVGRQVLSYDDDRILGGLDWTMAARRHDAAVLKYTDSTWALHVGGAYNQNSESSKFQAYNIKNGAIANYKDMQYLWFNKQLKKLSASFLFLNNGMMSGWVNPATNRKDTAVLYTQTIGLRTEYKDEKIQALVYGYYQMGDDATKSGTAYKWEKVSAFDLCAEVGYKPIKGMLATLGAEYISGNSQTDTNKAYLKVNHAFNPFYGTNHRFNGYMDYFYVGNHINSVGLLDAYLRLSYTYKKVQASLNSHYFSAAADVLDTKVTTSIAARDPHLGSEIDFTLSYNFTDGVAVQSGYSQIFATNTMKVVKTSGQINTNSNWAYVMLIIRPGAVKWPKVGLKM